MKRVVIKWTYLLALVAFGAWMVDTFFGGNIYLRGEGAKSPSVVISGAGEVRRNLGGRTVLGRIENVAFVAELRRGDAKHPAELAAA